MNSTIAAISTPPGKGGVAIIRMSGEESIEILSRVFTAASGKAVTDHPPRTQVYGYIIYNNERIDDGLVTVFPAPHSYTGETVVEISCHGGILITETVLKALKTFNGTERRFEYKGEIGGVTILDDYAHHPTEIEATLKAAANYPHKTLWCVFQPHTYTRTNAFLKEFAQALSLADKVILADIYAAREKNTIGITSMDLLKEIEKSGKECYYFPSFDEIENFLLENCINGDLLLTMGAGDIVKIGENLLGL